MNAGKQKIDLAGKDHWEVLWQKPGPAQRIDPSASGLLRNYVPRRFHQRFGEIFCDLNTEGLRLLEFGCARSQWLPYFALDFGFQVSGLDYSANGCEQARNLLARFDVSGEVVCTDLFDPPERLLSAFDVAVSFGVVEHFQPTSAAIAAMARTLKPRGRLVTVIPNLVGAAGKLQAILDRELLDKHVLLDGPELHASHLAAGLIVKTCDYFLVSDFGVTNIHGLKHGTPAWYLKSGVRRLSQTFSWMTWILDQLRVPIPASRLLSPYVICVAERPNEGTL